VPVNLNRLLRDTAEFLGPLARERVLTVQLSNTVDEVRVAADGHRLRQVFLNLALNSFHAMNPGGMLRIGARRAEHRDGFIQIDFRDCGKGIQPDVLCKIFEPGFTTKAGSPGLGLSVCRKVVEQHGGIILVDSHPGVGTTFSIRLPLLKGSR
jgi:signal transduction histidine kinase